MIMNAEKKEELIGKRLQLFRKLAGYSQEEASDKLRISREVLACYETDRALPSIDTLLRMRKLYKQTIDRLLGAPQIDFNEEMVGNDDYCEIVYLLSRPNFNYEKLNERVAKYYAASRFTKRKWRKNNK